VPDTTQEEEGLSRSGTSAKKMEDTCPVGVVLIWTAESRAANLVCSLSRPLRSEAPLNEPEHCAGGRSALNFFHAKCVLIRAHGLESMLEHAGDPFKETRHREKWHMHDNDIFTHDLQCLLCSLYIFVR
jgi:hypothetical protein